MLRNIIEKTKEKEKVYMICNYDIWDTPYMDSCKTIYNKVFLKDVKCTVRSRPIYSLFIINKYVYPNMPTLRCILESNIKYGESYFPIFTKEGFILKEYDGNEFFFIIYNTPPHKNKMLLDMLIEGSEREDLGFLNKPLAFLYGGRFKDIFKTIDDLLEFHENLKVYVIPTDFRIGLSRVENIRKRYKEYNLKIKFNKMIFENKIYDGKYSFIKYLELSF